MPVTLNHQNPILGPASVPPLQPENEVIGVFNAGVARFQQEILLLLRVAERPVSASEGPVRTLVYDPEEASLVIRSFDQADSRLDFSDPRLIVTPTTTYLTSLSYLRVARSPNGRDFTLDEGVLLLPENEYEAFGLEDPRITQIGATYYIHYVAVSPMGICTCLATTQDFRHVERLGLIFGPENKDVTLFPERIQGSYYALHRPTSPFSLKNEIWMAESPDLLYWGNHRYLLGLRSGHWDSARIGGGAPPLRIEPGWLAIYHGADANNRYCLGAVLLDAQKPWQVLGRSRDPILEPRADHECSGFFGHVVFTCGVLLDGDLLKVYYGAADTSLGYAEISLSEILAGMESVT